MSAEFCRLILDTGRVQHRRPGAARLLGLRLLVAGRLLRGLKLLCWNAAVGLSTSSSQPWHRGHGKAVEATVSSYWLDPLLEQVNRASDGVYLR